MHFSAIHAGSTVSPFLAPRLAFRLSWHPVGMALFRHSKSPGAGVDECFFLAGRSPDAKKARIAPRLFLFGLSLPLVGP